MHKSAFSFDGLNKQTLDRAKELNLDSVFTGRSSLRDSEIVQTRKELPQLKIYVELGCFSGNDLLEKFPDARPVEAKDKDIKRDWYTGICPTHPGVRNEIISRIKSVASKDIDGIWLDFIRYPTKWEEPEPYILDTCYCSRCLQMFEDYIGEEIKGVGGEGGELENISLYIDGSYYHEWLEFKSEQIVSMIKETRSLIDNSGKDIKLGAFVIPWDDSEYGNAIKRIVAQDFKKFAEYVDILSPMLYHKMCGKDVAWIKDKSEYFWNVGVPFLPLIQTEPKPVEITSEEFKKAINNACSNSSLGVCMFFLENLVNQSKLYKVAKEYKQG